jgi:8-oxo-dGTP pyrophosphatase MutT (NUDIX family)
MSAVLSHAQVCGVVLLREDGAALLQYRDDIPGIVDPGLWVFPGSHREDNETSEQAARREFLEETRYQCRDLQTLGMFPGATSAPRAIPLWSFSGHATTKSVLLRAVKGSNRLLLRAPRQSNCRFVRTSFSFGTSPSWRAKAASPMDKSDE